MYARSIYPISYGNETLEFQDNEGRVIFYAQAGQASPLPDPDALIENALSGPIGCPPLEALVKPEDTVAIIIDDITRPTPRQRLLRAVTTRLAGITGIRITLILALGTHRPMTQEEIETDLGEFAAKYPVVNISYTEEERFSTVGEMPDGTPIRVYKEILEADVLIGLGNIVPHIAAGWGGGAKIIMPGVCGKQTTDGIHILSCLDQNVVETSGNADNVFRKAMEELAGKVGLSFIVNTVLDENRNILGVFAGHYIAAHREGVRFAQQALCPLIPDRADILIISANPAHADFWQGAKPYVFALHAVKRGGVMILLLSAVEGLCGCAPAHEEAMRNYYAGSEEEIRSALQQGNIKDVLGLAEAFIRLQTAGFCHTLLVSDGLTEEDARLLGFEKVPDLDTAVKLALQRMGPDASIGIIPQGGDILCRVASEDERGSFGRICTDGDGYPR